MINFVTSIKDPVVEQARSLSTPKGRISHQKCLLEGIEQIEWALTEKTIIEYVFFESKEIESPFVKKLLELCAAQNTGNTKGQVLGAFIDAVHWTPKKVLFFDDSKSNVESVVNEMQKRLINCQGFLYRRAFIPETDPIDESILQLEFDYLKQYDEVIGDAQAAELIEKRKNAEGKCLKVLPKLIINKEV